MKVVLSVGIIACLTVLLPGALAAEAFIPSNQFELAVKGSVNYVPDRQTFKYSYSVKSSNLSQQDVSYFGVSYERNDLDKVASPPQWFSLLNFMREPVVMWAFDGLEGTPVSPGGMVSGFAFESPGLPSIQSWYAKSSYFYVPADDDEADTLAKNGSTYFYNNCKLGGTVGPGPLPPKQPSHMLDVLVATQQKAFNNNWTRDVGVRRSLAAKLEAVAAALQPGDRQAASSALKAYENELEAQRGKKLGNTLVDLLKANADFLLFML